LEWRRSTAVIVEIGFGGGCHWCTEAVFQSLKGVERVEQGWIASSGINKTYSEGVIVHYDNALIDLHVLTAIHLYTHSCTSQHALRKKYRSAVYTFNHKQSIVVTGILESLQEEFEKPIITQVLPFVSFTGNKEKYLNYYLKNPDSQFCQTYINPKLNLLLNQFSKYMNKQSSARATALSI